MKLYLLALLSFHIGFGATWLLVHYAGIEL
jgi:hypothetical protein